jgi:hypothetical protein
MSQSLPISLVVENSTFHLPVNPQPDIISWHFFQYKRKEIALDFKRHLGYKIPAENLEEKGATELPTISAEVKE